MSECVAVTGAQGFIGSHLVEALVTSNHRVRAMAHYNSRSSHGWLDGLPREISDEVEIVLGDVRDSLLVQKLVKGASTLYHLAALIAIPYSYEAPRSYVDVNVLGTVNVLEAARHLDVSRVVHTSTSEVYGTAQTVPISEDHPIRTQSPYSASKAAADRLVESYHASFSTPVVTLRPFNTYGPRQSMRAIIPAVVCQIAAGHRTISLGDLRPSRDFLYVKDTVAAFLAVGNAPEDAVLGGTFNAGTGVETSIGELVDQITTLMDADVEVAMDPARVRPATSEVPRLVCDAARLRSATGWRPTHSLTDGIQQTIDFLSDPGQLAGYKTAVYNV